MTFIEVTNPNSKSKSFPVIMNVAKPAAVVRLVIKVEILNRSDVAIRGVELVFIKILDVL